MRPLPSLDSKALPTSRRGAGAGVGIGIGIGMGMGIGVRVVALGAVLALGSFAAFARVPRAAAATPDEIAPFLGTYGATQLARHAAIIDRAITSGTEAMGPLRRSIGRRRLHAVNVPVRQLRIVLEGNDLVTEFDGERYVAPLGGGARRGRDPEGEPVNVSYRVRGRTLYARYVGDDGEKLIAFVLAETGELTLSVTLLSDQLPGPIRYRLPYARQ